MENFSADIKQAVDILRKGGIIIYPTDTIWGIGCDATNSKAVKRIFEIKHRADSKALITLVGSLAALERTVAEVPDIAYQLIEVTDKPLTIVYDKGINVAPELLAEDGSIGVRVTTEAFSAALCRAFGRPLVSTSANISGQPSPACFDEISDEVLKAADYVCSSRRNETAQHTPSSVIKISAGGLFKIIR